MMKSLINAQADSVVDFAEETVVDVESAISLAEDKPRLSGIGVFGRPAV